MSLLRFAGRALFSSYFVADGVQMVVKPDKNANEVSDTIEAIVPIVQSFLPPDVADKVPAQARTWTRILGATQIIGGVAYATGIARRPGAALLSLATLPRVVSAARAGAADRSDLFVQLALFGGALVATRDTAGRPGLAWRAEQSRKAAEQRVDQSRKSVQQHAEAVGKDVKRAQKKAQAKARKASKKVQAQVKDVLN